MLSLRTTLDCIGVTQRNVSVLRDLFGFLSGKVPADPEPEATTMASLFIALHGMSGPHVHLNVIHVGYDAIPQADQADALEKLDYAIHRARIIFRRQGLGIGRVGRYVINAEHADGNDDIGADSEAQDLWRSWSVPNNGIDVFVVRVITSDQFIGTSPAPGSCDKNSKDDGLLGGCNMLGGGNNRSYDGLARTFAHEIGHFLGLQHNHDDGTGCTNCPTTQAGTTNLMAQTRCTSPSCPGGTGVRDSTRLTPGQGDVIRRHCSVQPGC